MPEKQPQYDEVLKSLIDSTHIVPYDDKVPDTEPAMANCCGSRFVGGKTWLSMYGGKPTDLATWNTEKIIMAGFIEPDKLPILKVGRHFLRMKGNKKDFLVTWEDV